MFLPLEMIWRRVDLARGDSDTTLFLHLLYAGEMLSKLVTATFVGAIADDREKHRYRLIHRLLRVDGLGDWVQTLDEALIGPPSQHLLEGAVEDRRSLTERFGSDTWQQRSVLLLSNVVRAVAPETDKPPLKVPLREWFSRFAVLRNKTRAHGATTPARCADLCPDLEESIKLVCDNLPIFRKPWAYFHRNLSGKYRVVRIVGISKSFEDLKTSTGIIAARQRSLPDGIYVDFGEPVHVELLSTTVDMADFFLPNGGFKGKTFELLSLISDNRKTGDASAYMAPTGERPASETEGRGALDVVGNTWTNLPIASTGYVERPSLESELQHTLTNNRHPVVTLVGRGGIGKTSLAITVLNKIAQENTFEAILWFSGRDIDLLPEGPKVVTPRVLSQTDIADEYVKLLGPAEATQKGFKPLSFLAASLTTSPTGRPFLFVFDNFETVRNPGDLFSWLDTHIRLPNKILITTRHREFKADYPIDVVGMTTTEAQQLIESTSHRLAISQLLTDKYLDDIYEESDGHPYIIKILLGEVAKAGRLINVERIVAGKDDILDALFERTYAGLQPVARRVFLTLCSWRSLVPQLALEAVLLRPSNEKMDVGAAVDELVASSFVERTTAKDGSIFLDVALVASVFGRRKLATSPMKAAIDADVEFLQQIGATTASALRHGLRPRIDRLFQNTADRLALGREKLELVVPSLEFVCRQYPRGWLMLAKLHEELGGSDGLTNAAECLRRFLEHSADMSDSRFAWEELARLYQLEKGWTGAAHAYVQGCKLPDTSYSVLSNAANWLNNLLRENHVAIDTDEKRLLYREIAQLMERRRVEASATDLSRLAWLYLHLQDIPRALETAERGLALENDNEHCVRIVARLRP